MKTILRKSNGRSFFGLEARSLASCPHSFLPRLHVSIGIVERNEGSLAELVLKHVSLEKLLGYKITEISFVPGPGNGGNQENLRFPLAFKITKFSEEVEWSFLRGREKEAGFRVGRRAGGWVARSGNSFNPVS